MSFNREYARRSGSIRDGGVGEEGTKYQVATGEYNTKIDARIAEIKQTCGVQ
jgi:hypothetical protein